MRVVHYLNQFFVGIGGEDAADTPPGRREGPVGPGNLLARLLGDEHDVVATVYCGDDHAASESDAAEQIVELALEADAELLVAGPAFTSGRNGLACGRVVAAAIEVDLPAVASMHPDNVGVDEAGTAPVIEAGETSGDMRASMERLAAAASKLAEGGILGKEDGRVGRPPRRNRFADEPAARRAVDLVLRRLAGDDEATEIPASGFDVVRPAGPIEDPASAVIALATEGGLVPAGNPDGIEAARATRWATYEVAGSDRLQPGEWESVDGGFSTVVVNEDPNRMIPLDEVRALEADGWVGEVHGHFLVTTGNGMPVAAARRFGVEWASHLHQIGCHAAILTAT